MSLREVPKAIGMCEECIIGQAYRTLSGRKMTHKEIGNWDYVKKRNATLIFS